MSIRTSPWPNGVPCWADLMAPDVGRMAGLTDPGGAQFWVVQTDGSAPAEPAG